MPIYKTKTQLYYRSLGLSVLISFFQARTANGFAPSFQVMFIRDSGVPFSCLKFVEFMVACAARKSERDEARGASQFLRL